MLLSLTLVNWEYICMSGGTGYGFAGRSLDAAVAEGLANPRVEKDLRIEDYHIHVIGTPWRNITILELVTSEGITGYGESRVVGKTETVISLLKEKDHHFLGESALNRNALNRNFKLLDFGRAGEVTMTAAAMVDMACWDILGKKAGVPVYQLIGGDPSRRSSIPAYANGWYTGDRTPESFAEAAKKVVDRGYKALKFDPFGNGDLQLDRAQLQLSIKIIEAVYEAVDSSGVQMLIEMHGRFAPSQAVEIAKAIEKFNPGWIEEPCRPDNFLGHKSVRENTTIRVATGERLYTGEEFDKLFALPGTCDVIQPDITQCGGFTEVVPIAHTAFRKGLLMAPHNVGGIISTAAAVHLAAAFSNCERVEHFNDFADDIKGAGSPYPEVDTNGNFSIPTGSGWGIQSLDRDFIEAHSPRIDSRGVILDPGLNMFVNETWSKRGQGRATA